MTATGLPHSEIPGSKLVDSSPRLIAVFHVLHRLLMPRHPSCARIRLARNFPRQSRYVVILHNSTINFYCQRSNAQPFTSPACHGPRIGRTSAYYIIFFRCNARGNFKKVLYRCKINKIYRETITLQTSFAPIL